MNAPVRSRDLKLVALDREGLDVLSAHLQDSCAKPGGIAWLASQGRFVMNLMRYDWAGAKEGREERVGAVLRFDRVTKVSRLGDFSDGAALHLIGARFEKVDPPSGLIILAFADGGVIRIEVECIEAEFRDIGPRAPASECHGHWLTHTH